MFSIKSFYSAGILILFFQINSSDCFILVPDSAYENLILKIEGYPKEYRAELPIPPSKRESVRLLAASADALGYYTFSTAKSTSITVPQEAGDDFKKEIYLRGIIPLWIMITKDDNLPLTLSLQADTDNLQ